MLSALVPLIRYLQASLGVATFQALPAIEIGDIIFEFVEVILRRTKLQLKFRDIFSGETQWRILCDSMMLHARSVTYLPTPTVGDSERAASMPFWRRR